MIAIILAVLAGILIVVSRIINFNLSEKIGILQGTFFNYFVGLIFSLIFLIISGDKIFIGINEFTNLSWWSYLGGFVGVAVVALSIYLTPKISVFYMTIFIFLGQLFVGGVIDYIIYGEFSVGKAIGGILVLMGLVYNILLDKDNVQIEDNISNA